MEEDLRTVVHELGQTLRVINQMYERTMERCNALEKQMTCLSEAMGDNCAMLTATELAVRTGYSSSSISAMAKSGLIHGVVVGKSYRYPESTIARIIATKGYGPALRSKRD